MEVTLKIGIIILLSIISGILYRIGGTNKGTLWRDIGTMLCAILVLIYFGGFVYNIKTIAGLVATAGFTFASLTTYFKRKGADAYWWNWALVGLAFGLAALPFALATQYWLGFILRTVFLSVAVCLWSETQGNVLFEEVGRGVLLTASMPILLI